MNYLVVEPSTRRFVFLSKRPTEQECGGAVNSVELHTLADPYDWPGETPMPCVGRRDSTMYRVFRFQKECQKAGFIPIDGEAVLANSWTEYKNGDFVHLP